MVVKEEEELVEVEDPTENERLPGVTASAASSIHTER